MCDQRLITPINQCEFTGLERNASPLDTIKSLHIYIDNYGQTRLLAIENGQAVAGLLLSSGTIKTVLQMYTNPSHRRQGYMRELLAYARCKYGKRNIRFDCNLSTDGQLFAIAC